MKVFTMIIAIMGLSNLFAQSLTATYNADGSIQLDNIGRKGTSIQRIDKEGRTTELLFFFPGGQRMRMSDIYTYQNDLLVEQLDYIYTSGYGKTLRSFDSNGNEIDWKTYTSKDKTTWQIKSSVQRGFDHKNNQIYFRSKSNYAGYINFMSRTTYNYSDGTRSVYREEYDANDRKTSHYTNNGKMGDRAMNNEPYVFDINKDGPNYRDSRVVKWSGTDMNGNTIDKVFIDSRVISKTYDSQNRMIQFAYGSFETYEGDKPIYGNDEIIDYTYEGNKVVEIKTENWSAPLEKRIFEHQRNGKVKMTLYRQSEGGSWSKYDTEEYKDISKFTPHQRDGSTSTSHQAVAESYESPSPSSSSSNSMPSEPSYDNNNSYTSNGSLMNEVNAIDKSNDLANLSVSASDAEKLDHIVKILEHSSGQKVSEEQLINLALQLLIDEYKSDLRTLNNEYLEDKVSMFSE
ncbi:MAG: hypothetical protein ACI837_002391 [Crocinitomicaceae bacterium]|jgi:hypothetical protein